MLRYPRMSTVCRPKNCCGRLLWCTPVISILARSRPAWATERYCLKNANSCLIISRGPPRAQALRTVCEDDVTHLTQPHTK